jgi:peptidyl-prolyl cis-trans isomerase B (cyclophilin B)
VPSEKRARQRAAREARLAAEAKAQKRRRQYRNVIVVGVILVVVVGIVYLVSGNNNKKKPASASSTTTTVAKTTDAKAQVAANKVAAAAGCPASPSTRVNTQSYSSAPPDTINTGMLYSATVKTTVGTFTIALDAKSATNTVNSFVFLADKGYYNCNIFHRVVPGFVDQTGDPTGAGTGTPGYSIPLEAVPTSYATGDVAMGTSPATGVGSQWFIVAPGGSAQLDGDIASGGYPLFGRILTGQNVVNKINSEGSASGTPPDVTQRVISITIHEAPPTGS